MPKSPSSTRFVLAVTALVGAVLIGNAIVEAVETGHGASDEITIKLIDGSQVKGTVSEIDEKGIMTGTGIPADLSLDQVLEIATANKPATPATPAIQIRLTDGGTILASRCEIEDEAIRFGSDSGLTELPLETISAVVWKGSAKVDETIQNRLTDNDAVVVKTDNGEQVVVGILESVTPQQIKINYQGKSRNISFDNIQVNAIVIADLKLKKISGTTCRLTLTDGSTVAGRMVSFDGELFSVQLTGGHVLTVNRSRLVGIKVFSDSLVFLSDLDPIDVQQRSVFTVQRGWKRDQSVEGHPLTFRFKSTNQTKTYGKGIGTQSYSEIVFENTGDFDRFRALVGIDAETEGRGDCNMIVKGDGTYLWSQRIQADQDPVEVSIDIKGVREIALVVQPGEQFDLADHADWTNARFTKSE